jgi:hypothetical protein
MATVSITVSTKDSSKTVLSDFVSVPKTTGIGPIMMAPSPLIFHFLTPETESKITAITMITTPTKIRVIPSA